MKLAYFPGCKINFYLKDYDTSFKSLMEKLGVDLVQLPFNCCGYPARSTRFEVSVFSSIRNFALARKYDLDIITPCKCCFGQLKYASYQWHENKELKQKMDCLLADENLFWDGKTKIKHLLSFLYNDIGVLEIKKKINHKLPEKKIVTQYGCHALRPFAITGFDNPHAPQIFEELINITGFKTVEWSKSTECCGNPIYETNKKLSLKILNSKLNAALESGADHICTACTHCQIQYNDLSFQNECQKHHITPVLFTQILGAALGIKKEKLGEDRLPIFDLRVS